MPSPVTACGVGSDAEYPAAAAGGQQHGLGVEDVNLAGCQRNGRHARRAAFVDQQIQQKELVVEIDVVLDALLVEGLQDHVPRAIGAVAGAAHRGLAAVAGVPAEGPLGNLTVRRAAERQAPMFQLVHRFDRLAAKDLHGVLVGQVVRAFDRVEHVPLPMVFFLVAQGGADPTLRSPGVGAGRIKFADHRHAGGPAEVQGGHQAGPSRPHNDRIVPMVHKTLRPKRRQPAEK